MFNWIVNGTKQYFEQFYCADERAMLNRIISID